MAYYQGNYRKGGYGSRTEAVEEEVYSVPVKAGKRIYYFDVKATRGDDYFLTITESRKKPLRDGSFAVEKHKIHLYKEDFMKFAAGLQEALEYVRKAKPDFAEAESRGDFDKPYAFDSSESSATRDMEKELFGNY